MAFEQRNNRSYYYRKERTAGRVRSVYIGNGEIAGTFAAFDWMRRDEKEFEKQRREQARRDETAVDESLDELAAALDALVTAALLTNGYHQHKRQWRRKRK